MIECRCVECVERYADELCEDCGVEICSECMMNNRCWTCSDIFCMGRD